MTTPPYFAEHVAWPVAEPKPLPRSTPKLRTRMTQSVTRGTRVSSVASIVRLHTGRGRARGSQLDDYSQRRCDTPHLPFRNKCVRRISFRLFERPRVDKCVSKTDAWNFVGDHVA